MDIIVGLFYLFVLMILAWIIYKKDCRLALFMVGLFFVFGILEIAIIYYYRSRGDDYQTILNNLVGGDQKDKQYMLL